MKDVEKMLSTKEVAKILGLSHRTLENYRQNGRGPKYVKVGGCIRYKVSDVMEWIELEQAPMAS